MKLVYGVQKWEAVKVVERINTIEIMEDADWRDTKPEAIELAEKIAAEKPEGCVRVTVGRFHEDGEMADDEYIAVYDLDGYGEGDA